MNGNNGGDHQPGGQLSHQQLSLLLNAAGGGAGGHPNAALMASLLGGGGATGVGGAGFRGFGSGGGGGAMSDGVATSLEDQILQRASALRAEALMQQHQQQHQLEAALAALHQQQQMSALGALGGGLSGAQEQEALVARAGALRELGLAAGGQGAAAAALHGAGGLERLQLELDFASRLEEIERARRMHLTGLSGGIGLAGGASGSAQAGGVTSPSLSSVTSSAAATSLRPPESISKGVADTVLSVARPGTKDARVSSTSPSSLLPTQKAKRKEKKPVVPAVPKAIATTDHGADGTSETANVTSASGKSKDELRKTPGTVIVPCRARGMPMDHNFKTAYFVISENAKHGEDLVCSYFACRNGGVKFRYCAHCMAPVAKRNFCRRHDHGMSANKQSPSLGANGGNDDDDDDMDESVHTAERDPGDVPFASLKEAKEEQTHGMKPGLTSSGEAKRKREESEDHSDKDAERDDGLGQEVDGVPELTIANVSEKRRKMWSNLLARRPRTKDPRNLSSWLNEVLTVSDMEFPIDRHDADQASGAALINGDSVDLMLAPPASESKTAASGSTKVDRVTDANGGGDVTKANNKAIKAKKIKSDGKVSSKIVKKVKVKKTVGPSKATEVETGSDIPPRNSPLQNSDRTEETETLSEKAKEVKGQETTASSSVAESQTKAARTKAEQDGFVGSFADWRDRKKGKALKKGAGSLRK